jgi:hypothetical protein
MDLSMTIIMTMNLWSFHVEEFVQVRLILDIFPLTQNHGLLLRSFNDWFHHLCPAFSACNM